MARKKAVPELSAAEIRRRLDAVRDSIASTTIEGGSVTPETEALLVEWAHGRITESDVTARLDERYGAPKPVEMKKLRKRQGQPTPKRR